MLSKMSKENLEMLSYAKIAELYLKENKKPMNTADLFKEVCKLLELSDEEYQERIGDFFESLTTSKEFILLNDGNWDLRANHSVKIDIDDIYEEVDSEEDDEDVIDLLELFRAILKHIKLIIVLCILFGVGGFFGTKLLIAPTYTASTSIYLTPQISESGSLDYNSQMANSKLVTNALNLLTQNNIMSEVAKDVGLESAESVKKLVSVSNESNTEIITISATTTDPKLSKDIANDTVSTFIRTMQKNLNVRNIEVVDKAKLSYVPSGPNVKKNTLLATMVGLVLGCGYATLRFLFDNRLRTKEEAEKYLGIPVFCEIPEL